MTLQCDAVDNVTAFSLSFRFAFGYYESTSFFKFPELQKYFFLVLPTWGYLKCYFSCCFNFIPRTTNISFSVGCLRLPWSSWASAPAGGISFRRKKGNRSSRFAGWEYYLFKCPWIYKKEGFPLHLWFAFPIDMWIPDTLGYWANGYISYPTPMANCQP